ncbi:ANM_HP_G0086000.mRNA.1.CDS.1 [Saccharomyces cerevisiae]|nr:ANM_HP_G0098830.mRNA.1.CDS.1 [Saccharomyces cerevisiae]CAI4990520.1 ANM_HP_G0154220.mRNA.1.CDS.1 [Saccharomyces cerevisiae]CAI5190838.1 ANM_HP_G0245510.mRNA.1.CDS.1 [Saccharomyces cerevisiae]CAI5213185.1 ANM_HP_G0279460.mRNA.1.CDS.1 [Saccharomyces cerevisiae]CAI5213287.1 ANM_HP_G0012220.mRNA.1.CDS.1 [Saccharomyces cerevisiae]
MTKRNTPPLRSSGINTIQINAAREMHAQTVRARRMPMPTSGITTPSVQPTAAPATPPRHICNNPNNPQCLHCGSVIIPSPRATLPLEDNPSISINDWTISSRKKPILNSQELDIWENEKLKGLTLPEMIFGNNYIRIENSKQHWSIEFNALDALKEVQLQDSGIRVAYSNDWIKSKKRQNSTNGAQRFTNDVNDDSLNIIHKYDWTYTTRYKGTESSPESKFRLDNDQKLPLDKLAVHDKILFYDDMILFEDELADNGISIFNVKIRVMNERLLLLSRFFLRVDDVLVRVYDTRIYVEFDENVVIRESKEFEGKYQDVLAKHRLSQSHDPKAALRDSNWVAQNTPMIKRQCEIIQF